MATKFVTGIQTGDDSFQTAQAAATAAKNKLNGRPPNLVIVFCSSQYDYPQVLTGIKDAVPNTPVLGCSTAGEFTEEKVLNKSIAVGIISSDNARFFLSLADGLSADPFTTVQHAVSYLPKHVEGYPYLSAILLHDGLSGKGEQAVLSTLAAFGSDIQFTGGAAGDDLKFKSTSVFVNGKVAEDAVAICLIASQNPISTSTKHGHHPISQDLIVTRADESILYEVNGEPAWDVWVRETREKAKELGIHVDQLKDPSEVGQFLIRYELGLPTADGHYKIRVPLSKNPDGSLNFACTIAEGATFRITESPKQDQIDSAREAARLVKERAGTTPVAGAIIFDCCCRGIILGEEFYRGVDAIKQELGDIPLLGFETYGEICMTPGQFSGFHNTTTVIMLIPE